MFTNNYPNYNMSSSNLYGNALIGGIGYQNNAFSQMNYIDLSETDVTEEKKH
jgi:hypothetical protein